MNQKNKPLGIGVTEQNIFNVTRNTFFFFYCRNVITPRTEPLFEVVGYCCPASIAYTISLP